MACTEHFEAQGDDRPTALHKMLALYAEHSEENEPVHSWELPTAKAPTSEAATVSS